MKIDETIRERNFNDKQLEILVRAAPKTGPALPSL